MGSPRSGTSILTWCLGQHSNIFVQEESDWIGPFAYQLDLAYRRGSVRGERSQLSALGVQREKFFAHFGQSITDLILDNRRTLLATLISRRSQDSPEAPKPQLNSAFQIHRSESDPKGRWVDGTPEYSLYIHGLRMLFPEARFIHLVREVDAVVRSMMNFERTGGPVLVGTEQHAYEYWLRTVRACREAELAYGSEIVCRIRHSDLISQPEITMKRLLAFLVEPFEPACLEPLCKRINSSEVPVHFDPSDPRTDPEIIEEAKRLQAEIMLDPTLLPPDQALAAEMEESFRERSTYLANLEPENEKCSRQIAKLREKLDRAKAHRIERESISSREQSS